MANQEDYRAEFNPFMIEGNTFGRYYFYTRTSTTPTYEDFSGCEFKADLIRDGSSVIESSTANSRLGTIDADDVSIISSDYDITLAVGEGFFWEISATDAAVLTAGNYTYDILVTWPSGTVRSRWFGKLRVEGKRSE